MTDPVARLINVTRRGIEFSREHSLATLCSKGWHHLLSKGNMWLSVRRQSFTQSVGGTDLRCRVYDDADYRLSVSKDEDDRLVDDIVSELEHGDVFFDIGAAIGLYSLAVTKQCPGVTTVSFEPNPHNAELFRENATLNNLDPDLFEMALSDVTGSTAFPTDEASGGGQISIGTASTDGESTPTMTGDEFVSEYGHTPTVCKIDVEGAEPLVVDGFRNTLRDPETRVVYCEVHRPQTGNKITDFGSTPEDFEQTLRDLGFSIEVLRDPHPEWNYFIKATSE